VKKPTVSRSQGTQIENKKSSASQGTQIEEEKKSAPENAPQRPRVNYGNVDPMILMLQNQMEQAAYALRPT